MADDGHRFPGLDAEGNVLDHAVVALVGEAYVAKFHARRQRSPWRSLPGMIPVTVGWQGSALRYGLRDHGHGRRSPSIRNAYRSIQELEDALRAGHGRLK